MQHSGKKRKGCSISGNNDKENKKTAVGSNILHKLPSKCITTKRNKKKQIAFKCRKKKSLSDNLWATPARQAENDPLQHQRQPSD